MTTDPDLCALRHRISDGLKGDLKMLDFKCTECGVGIDKGSETFVISPKEVKVWCVECWRERNA